MDQITKASAPVVVVAGATGRVGRLIVKELVARGFRVRALLIRPFDAEQPPGLDLPGVQRVFGQLESQSSLAPVMEGADYLISAIGSTKWFSTKELRRVDVLGNQTLARAAKAGGIKHMVVISSVGAGNSREAMTYVFRLIMLHVIEAKTQLEEAVRATGMDHTIVRPGGYTKKPLSGRLAVGEGGRITGLVNRAQVATFCVDAITKPEMKNRTFEIVDAAKVKPAQKQFVTHV